jgi:ectoine hydroxylase-related dioxygenase (phytanoyl-CoA dioxygenase family)
MSILTAMPLAEQLREHGWVRVDARLPSGLRARIRDSLFTAGRAGSRCLLDQAPAVEAARLIRSRLVNQGLLTTAAVAIQAITFDKNATTNWKVSWHQDLMFPFAKKVSSPGYLVPSVKDGIHFARPPACVLEELLAVRLHLDDCGPENGPLRVSPGTHRLGILPAAVVADHVRDHGQSTCLAGDGEAVLMRPLLLHASSQATRPGHRRVLHIVYHSGAAIPEPWHQTL